MRLFFLILILFSEFNLFSVFDEKNFLSKPTALSGAYTGYSKDENAFYYNPAGLRLHDAITVSLNQTNLFGISDLKLFHAGFTVPTLKLGTFSFNYVSFGPSYYKEDEIYFTESFSFHEGFYAGFNLKNSSLKIEGGGSASTIGIDVGFLANVSESFSFGFMAKNLNRPQIGSSRIDLSRSFHFGISYTPFNGFIVNLDHNYYFLQESENLEAGMIFSPLPFLKVLSGVSSDPVSFSFGLSLKYKKFFFDYSFINHSELGYQHVFSISFKFLKGEETRTEREYGEEYGEFYEEEQEKIDLNEVTLKGLLKVPGMTKRIARRIIAYRESKGGFKSVDELLKIRGISRRRFEKIKDYFYVEEYEEVGESVSLEEEKKRLWNKAMSLYKEGKLREAREVFEKILEIDPEHDPSKKRIKMIDEELGE